MKKDLKAGIILNYLFIVLSNAASIVLTPLLLKGMGTDTYGLYILVFTNISLFAVADFGIGTSVIRDVAAYCVKVEREELSSYLSSIFWAYMGFAVAALAICAVFTAVAPTVFKNAILPQFTGTFRLMFMLASGNVFLLFFQNYLFSIITGHERVAFTRLINIFKIIIRTAAIFLVAVSSRSFFSPHIIFFIDIVLTALVVLSFYIYVRKKLEVRLKIFHLKNFGSGFYRQKIGRMLLLYTVPISESLYWSTCNSVIAMLISSESVGVFSIAVTFVTIFIQIAATLSYLNLPTVTELRLSDNKVEFNKFMLKTGRTNILLLSVILVGFIAAGKTFLDIWIGLDFDIAYYLAAIMMVSHYLYLSESMLEMVLFSDNKYLFKAVITAAATVVNIILVVWLTGFFGIVGAALAVLITTFVFKVVGMNLYYMKLGLKPFRYLFEVTKETALPVAAAVLLCYFAFRGQEIGITVIRTVAALGVLGAGWLLIRKLEGARTIDLS